MRKISRRALRSAAAILSAAIAGAAHANTWTNGGGDALWSNPLNWTDGVPTPSDNVTFPGAIVGSSTIILPSGASANGLTFFNAYTLTGGTLNMSFMGAYNTGPVTINTQLISSGIQISPAVTIALNAANNIS